MAEVDNQKQLNNFDLIKRILKGNSTLSKKFKDSDYYEYEPKGKSYGNTFTGYPYIWIQTPSTDTDPLVLTRTTTIKDFSAVIILRVDYEARSNFKNSANAIIRQLELPASTTTLEAAGFYHTKIDLVDVDDQLVINQKTLVQGTFILTNMGNVER